MDNLHSLIIYSEFIVRRYYRVYGSIYHKADIDYEDLKTIASLVVWKIVERYKGKPIEELKKIASVAVGRKLNRLKDRAKIKKNKVIILETERMKEPIEGIEETEEQIDITEENGYHFEVYNEKEGAGSINTKLELDLDELKEILKLEDFRKGYSVLNQNALYDMLYYRYVEGLSLQKIADKYGESKQNVSRLILKTCKKLKKYF
jgi:RNA polymerase sigma factor (sigma-70 family)